jgi:hypothetical protein
VLERIKVQGRGRRFLFGVKVGDYGFLSDRGQAFRIDGDDDGGWRIS